MLARLPELDPAQEHAEDVLATALRMAAKGQKFALAIVTATEGGAVRAPGALMIVSEAGDAAGYVSGGCIDSDLIGQAQSTLEQGAMKRLRYGAGSPFLDLRLPCGGAIEILIWPNPDLSVLNDALGRLKQREAVQLVVAPNGSAALTGVTQAKSGWAGDHYVLRFLPKLRLRVAGRGAELVALSRVAAACNLPICVQSPDKMRALAALDYPDLETVTLHTPSDVPANVDDPWTAFVLMFHDPDWETALLADALSGQAFFIGAIGSRATQARRREHLLNAGVSETEIDRIRGPLGLVSSLRDASLLAVSALAEIIDVHRETFTS